MRILVSLSALESYNQNNFEYHHPAQGFVYSLLRNTTFEGLHDKKGYKFFCFSNIFHSKNDKSADTFNLIISSPSTAFIDQLNYQLQKLIDNQVPLRIKSLFVINKVTSIPARNLKFPLKVKTSSPILIRIPSQRFLGYSTSSIKYPSVYWRYDHPTHLFIDALESNLRKKYKEYSLNNHHNLVSLTSERRLVHEFQFKKQVSTNIQIHGSRIPIIGSLWEFLLSEGVDPEFQLFALDCGFGERNSLGFGFMNPILDR